MDWLHYNNNTVDYDHKENSKMGCQQLHTVAMFSSVLECYFFGNFQLALFSFQVKNELAASIDEGKGEVKIVPETLD